MLACDNKKKIPVLETNLSVFVTNFWGKRWWKNDFI